MGYTIAVWNPDRLESEHPLDTSLVRRRNDTGGTKVTQTLRCLLGEDVAAVRLLVDQLPGPRQFEALGRRLHSLHLRHEMLLRLMNMGQKERNRSIQINGGIASALAQRAILSYRCFSMRGPVMLSSS